jgi:hypothetical protein
MLNSMNVAEKSSVNTKRFRSQGAFAMGLLGWLRREKEEVEVGARLRKEWCAPRIKLHGEVIRMGGKSKKKRAKKKEKEE